MTEIDQLVRENVKKLVPYSSARDDYQGSKGTFLDANESPFGKLNRYPDPYQKVLKSKISLLKNVPAENIFLGNGSDEIIDLSIRIFCEPAQDKVLTFHPTYGMYEVSAAVNNVEVIKVPLNEKFLIDADALRPYYDDRSLKLIIICSPNNPTGNSMDPASVKEILRQFRGIVLIDEAYIDFASTPSFKEEISSYPKLIVMQTFSKAYAMASVRVGMAFADQQIIRFFNKVKPPYNISSVNQATVLNGLVNSGKIEKYISKILAERERVVKELRSSDYVTEIFPSDSNFLLVKVTDSDLIYRKLAEKGVIVRNRNSLVKNCLRITIGTARENNMMLKSLKKILL
jgi:histidinol-phosphate aminotransferase